ncbi:AraC family transcriptional regulator [Dawidia soli]|uniref:Helix-turn-helix domain-containing protein n=1 Tax=Dawidia soli TaxID=2782352 RepID=A0AAP2GHS6_9BACT|nr:helix-turn-helix domain-containing protein [Dawidia soli]MBT1686303.1 helix-turn-helix domain-containing protein [Dawidia soli]
MELSSILSKKPIVHRGVLPPVCKTPGRVQFEAYSLETFRDATAWPNADYVILWIVQGTVVLTTGLDRLILEDSSICYGKPSRGFDVKINNGATGFVICFSREFVELYGASYSNLIDSTLLHHRPSAAIIRLDDAGAFLQSIALEIMQELQSNARLRLEAISALLKFFLINLIRRSGGKADGTNSSGHSVRSRKADIVNKFYARLEEDFAANKTPRYYAETLHVTPNYLNQIVKELSGYTVTQHIQQRIILEAKRKVLFEGYSMKEISYLLGFVDPAHFSKYFKKSCGENFSDFKRGALYQSLQTARPADGSA